MAQRPAHKGMLVLGVALLAVFYGIGRWVARKPRLSGIGAVDDCGPIGMKLMKSRHPNPFLRRIVRRVAKMGKHLRILDIGCGAGQLALALARLKNVSSTMGVDLSAEMVSLAQERALAAGASANYLVADATDLPFSEGAFDVVVTTLSLHHWENPEGVLREARRVLTPGGTLLLLDLRRDGAPVIVGGVTAASWVLQRLTGKGEGMAQSFAAAFQPWEAALLLVRAGFHEPRLETYLLSMLITARKEGVR
jgi:ubiquinone/menaquinone biosynthesis C-methylase UbiE